MIHRLKARLELANFKRQNGYERYDLHTLETNLLKSHIIKKRPIVQKPEARHRYYPTSSSEKQRHYIRPFYKTSSFSLLHYPLSAKRSTSPHNIPSDEDAANLLVMLHNMA
jgi:hypothetical protein